MESEVRIRHELELARIRNIAIKEGRPGEKKGLKAAFLKALDFIGL